MKDPVTYLEKRSESELVQMRRTLDVAIGRIEDGWIKGHWKMAQYSGSSYCVEGAIRDGEKITDKSQKVTEHFLKTVLKIKHNKRSLMLWNDKPTTRKADVLRLLRIGKCLVDEELSSRNVVVSQGVYVA